MSTRLSLSKMSKLIGNLQQVFIGLMILCFVFVVFIMHVRVDIDTTTPVTIKRPNSTTNCSDVPPKILAAATCGRLGNQLFLYATLYALAKRNNQTGAMRLTMTSTISPYFKISVKTINESQVECISWKKETIPSDPRNCVKVKMIQEPYVMFTGIPISYKCFEDYLPEIRKEFQFKDQIAKKSKEIVKNFGHNTTTTVGVHVRRTDYVEYAAWRKFQLPTIEFYKGAMKYFQKKYPNVIFIVASDDIPWCKSNFNQIGFNVNFLNGTPVEDLAVLANCDHLIFGVGTFGFWAGFLNKGQVVYCSDCHSKTSNSYWLTLLNSDYKNFVLPPWIGFNLEGKLWPI